MPACLHDHRDLTAIIEGLRVEWREQWREIQRLRVENVENVENEVLREAAEPLIHHAPHASDSLSSTACAAGSASGTCAGSW